MALKVKVIIAGDLFDDDFVSRDALDEVLTLIKRATKTIFFYLPGNHEGDIIEKSGLAVPDNLMIFGKKWTYFKIGEVNIIGRSETNPEMFSDISLSGDEKNIVVLHGELRDRSDYSGVIGTKDIYELPIDYLALGHYHTYSSHSIGARTSAVYCGTPEGRGFDEVGDKGFVIIDIDRYSVFHQFKATAKRALRICKVDVTGIERTVELEDAIESEVSRIERNDLVRVQLTGSRTLGNKYDTEYLESLWKDRFYYFEIKDETNVSFCAEDFKNDKSLKGEFIRGVIADESLDEKMKELVITMGLRALMGKEID